MGYTIYLEGGSTALSRCRYISLLVGWRGRGRGRGWVARESESRYMMQIADCDTVSFIASFWTHSRIETGRRHIWNVTRLMQAIFIVLSFFLAR